ncbi:MAG: WbqC family protein [Chitinophagaceae bacterium]
MIYNDSIIVDNQYFANIIYYKKIVNFKNVIIEQYDEHKKKSFANRSTIAGANGIINLSVPLEKGRSQRTISRDVRIWNEENWQLRHWRSILSCYNNSPWFKYLSDELAVIFSRRFEFLLDWNLACFNWTLKILRLDLTYQLTEEWRPATPAGTSDCRNTIQPGDDNFPNPIRYQQVFENKIGFIPGLSILDLLFCEGPKSSILLLQA